MDCHQALVRRDGSYIFVNPIGRTKKLSAKSVSKRIGIGKWFKDRDYPHKFLNVDKVF